MTEANTGRARLRELLDAALEEDNVRLQDMADSAFSSPFHFSRELSRGARESPVALRRRVLLERAAWQISQRSEEHTSELQSRFDLVCRLLLEKKKRTQIRM